MKNPFLFTLSFVLLFSACKLGNPKATAEESVWYELLNQTTLTKYIQNFFFENSALLVLNNFIIGPAGFHFKLNAFLDSTGNIESCHLINTTADKNGDYLEIGTCSSSNQQHIAYVNAWKKQENQQHVLEIQLMEIQETSDTSFFGDLHSIRKDWVRYSNEHNTAGLLENTYTEEAIYFSGGEITQGREAISERYDYMNNPDWNIQLYARELLAVRDDLVFEIGNYVSSGKGQYILIWEKSEDGLWMISFDFNF